VPASVALEVILHSSCANHNFACREDDDLWGTLSPWNAKLQTKEPQFFNRWPLPTIENYLHAWHSGVVGAMLSGAAGQRVLLDASPQYLMSAVAPPRLKASIPHARFVLVVRVRYSSPCFHDRKLPKDCSRSMQPAGTCSVTRGGQNPMTDISIDIDDTSVNIDDVNRYIVNTD
jgi:hypothetical protein